MGREEKKMDISTQLAKMSISSVQHLATRMFKRGERILYSLYPFPSGIILSTISLPYYSPRFFFPFFSFFFFPFLFLFSFFTSPTSKKKREEEKNKSSTTGIFLKCLALETQRRQAALRRSWLMWQGTLTASLGSLCHRFPGLTSHSMGPEMQHKTCIKPNRTELGLSHHQSSRCCKTQGKERNISLLFAGSITLTATEGEANHAAGERHVHSVMVFIQL